MTRQREYLERAVRDRTCSRPQTRRAPSEVLSLVETCPPRPWTARRVLAHAGQRQVLLDGVLRGEGAAQSCRATSPFVLMTDREDLDGQIWRTFIGCGLVDENRRRVPDPGRSWSELLRQNHRFIFSLDPQVQPGRGPEPPYSERDDIIVISDEAHRTQAGKLARNMRIALPNAAFIGFTGTPLFKHDDLTRRIFGDYVSRYDFKRSEEDDSTVKLVYENRGEKLGIARLDLNDRIAEAIEKAELDQTRKRCWRSCWVRTTRSSPPTIASTRLPTISWSTARPAGNRASRCSCASTSSPAPGCIQRISPAGRQRLARGARPRFPRGPSWPSTSTDSGQR